MIPGDLISVDLREQTVCGKPCIVLELIEQDGHVGCRWEKDANRYQVAAALECLAAALRNPEI